MLCLRTSQNVAVNHRDIEQRSIWVGRVFKYSGRWNSPSICVGWNRTMSGGRGREKRLAGVDIWACLQSDFSGTHWRPGAESPSNMPV